ncbi:hypothetical protein JW710_02920 [Candidatus Dojkabacteria bacterium]|nr:hypothetical protein [Candidatus Dojkabacteria bacterium]
MKKIVIAVVLFAIVITGGVLLYVNYRNNEKIDKEDQEESVDQGNDEESQEEEDTEEEETEDSSTGETDMSKFSEQTQTVGNSSGKDSAEYDLMEINDTAMDGYHRFEFVLESDEEDFAEVEATLVSSGGYIKIRLDRVTSDSSGIPYQGQRTINKDGVVKLYHAVTPNEAEEVYNIGIDSDTSFYLHQGEGLTVILDVKYPGTSDENESAVEDPEEFSSGVQSLTGTNTTGDVRIGSYSWGVEGSVLKFTWSTSSASGNPTPPTTAEYISADKKIVVKFGNVQKDSVLGSDNVFEADLSSPVERVEGSKSGGDNVYEFILAKGTEYRIYRTTSPNQIVIEIKR